MTKPTLLVVDDSETFRDALDRALSREFCIRIAGSSDEAKAQLSPLPDAALLDLRLRDDDVSNLEGLELLRELRREHPEMPVLMMTAYGDVATAVECMRLGAADFIQKGSDLREFRARVERALEHSRLASRVTQLEHELAIIEPRVLIGRNNLMLEVRELVSSAAGDGRVTVLISGETGTGKELVARAIHASGPRADKPFVSVVVASLPSTMIESELFGFEKGSFTDARAAHVGFIERANRGVLLLDEVGELDPMSQVKLLRFLEERTISRLGGKIELDIDVQVLAASNADLGSLVTEGRFREDLYYRLKVFEIPLPPLREHRDDIPFLLEQFLKKFGAAARGVVGVSGGALDVLTTYRWPGNVRELRNALESALLRAVLRKHKTIEAVDLPKEVGRREAPAKPPQMPERATLDEAVARAELAEVEHALESVQWKKTEAWRALGLNNRFALRRRVVRIFSQFPQLADAYPRLARVFKSEIS